MCLISSMGFYQGETRMIKAAKVLAGAKYTT